MFILLTARPTGHETTSALPSVYERNETPPYTYFERETERKKNRERERAKERVR